MSYLPKLGFRIIRGLPFAAFAISSKSPISIPPITKIYQKE